MSDDLQVEEMLVTFRGLDFRLRFCVRHEARRAWCECQVKIDGEYRERAGLLVRENEQKFQRGLEWLYAYALEHGTGDLAA